MMLGWDKLFIAVMFYVNFLHCNLGDLLPLTAGRLNHRDRAKHSYSKEDEKKGSHSRALLGACVTRGYGKEKRNKKLVTWQVFFLSEAAFGNLWKRLYVREISRRNSVDCPVQNALKCPWNNYNGHKSSCVKSPTYTDAHYEITRKWHAYNNVDLKGYIAGHF